MTSSGAGVLESLRQFSLAPEDFFAGAEAPPAEEKLLVDGAAIPVFRKEFWTASQRQGHSLHEVSYRACFKAELPRFFIELLTAPGACIYDPFMGRGTTLLEAALLGRIPAGNDVNPLSAILLEPRLDPPELAAVSARLDEIDWHRGGEAEVDLSMFYSAATLRQIMSLRAYLAERRASGAEDAVDRWIRMVATNRLTGHSSGFFSVYTMPPNQAVSADAQRKINEKRGQVPPDRDVAAIIYEKSRTLLARVTTPCRRALSRCRGAYRLFHTDARERSPLDDDTVDLVVTSPPFLDVVDYAGDNWLRCWFNGIDAEAVARRITVPRAVDAWVEAMEAVLRELFRVVRPGGWVAFEVGEVRGGKVRLDELIAPAGMRAGFRCHAICINEQQFTKTANCWGVANNAKGTNSNRIVLFRKG